ncbi:MAG TPA: hypothetical protein PLU82_00545 [Oscillospiraceae bacterium]|nr:hypothetical protein [Oscillospiraceae bacterium]
MEKRGLFSMMNTLRESLYPSRCPACGKILPAGCDLCADCAAKLEPVPHCLAADLPDGMFTRAAAAYYYSGPARDAVSRYKFHFRKRHAATIAKWLYKAYLVQYGGQRFDLVAAPPDACPGEKHGPFPHNAVLAETFARYAGLPFAPGLLIKTRPTAKQHTLSAEKRGTNLIGAFRAKRDLSGLRILLADDILTSGNTAWFCAEALKKAGASEVCVVTAALTKSDLPEGPFPNSTVLK